MTTPIKLLSLAAFAAVAFSFAASASRLAMGKPEAAGRRLARKNFKLYHYRSLGPQLP